MTLKPDPAQHGAAAQTGGTDRGLFGQGVQPWAKPRQAPDAEAQERREALLAALASTHLATVEARVGIILQDYPETRDSDVQLAIRYWKRFQSDVLNDCEPFVLEVLHDLQAMSTLIRSRQRIQNDYGLWVGTIRTRQFRDERQMLLYQYLAETRTADREICFYLDETGSEPTGRFVGVGGVCVLDSGSYEIRHAALKQWRLQRGWPETLHFADMGTANEYKFKELLAAIERYRSGLMFVGYAIQSRSNRQNDLIELFAQLVIDSLRVLDKHGCLESAKSVRVIKEAADGFDAVYLNALEQNLGDLIYQQFPERVFLRPIQAVPKGREVLLEGADIIAASMKRRWESGRRIHKDRVAQAVMNVTGFEDKADGTPLYKIHL